MGLCVYSTKKDGTKLSETGASFIKQENYIKPELFDYSNLKLNEANLNTTTTKYALRSNKSDLQHDNLINIEPNNLNMTDSVKRVSNSDKKISNRNLRPIINNTISTYNLGLDRTSYITKQRESLLSRRNKAKSFKSKSSFVRKKKGSARNVPKTLFSNPQKFKDQPSLQGNNANQQQNYRKDCYNSHPTPNNFDKSESGGIGVDCKYKIKDTNINDNLAENKKILFDQKNSNSTGSISFRMNAFRDHSNQNGRAGDLPASSINYQEYHHLQMASKSNEKKLGRKKAQ